MSTKPAGVEKVFGEKAKGLHIKNLYPYPEEWRNDNFMISLRGEGNSIVKTITPLNEKSISNVLSSGQKISLSYGVNGVPRIIEKKLKNLVLGKGEQRIFVLKASSPIIPIFGNLARSGYFALYAIPHNFAKTRVSILVLDEIAKQEIDRSERNYKEEKIPTIISPNLTISVDFYKPSIPLLFWLEEKETKLIKVYPVFSSSIGGKKGLINIEELNASEINSQEILINYIPLSYSLEALTYQLIGLKNTLSIVKNIGRKDIAERIEEVFKHIERITQVKLNPRTTNKITREEFSKFLPIAIELARTMNEDPHAVKEEYDFVKKIRGIANELSSAF